MHDVVYSSGPCPADVMVIGEAPGATEAKKGLPLVGISGAEHNRAAARNRWPHRSLTYVTNVVKDYRDGNPDPTPEDIAKWAPHLLDEVAQVQPKVIVTLGRFAARFFLGQRADMRAINGVLHFGNEWREDGEDHVDVGDAVIVPIYHPAYGLRSASGRALVEFGYKCAGRVINNLERGKEKRNSVLCNDLKGLYKDVETLEDLKAYVDYCDIGEEQPWSLVGFDTEGVPGNPWSWQVSMRPGTGVTVRCAIPEFADCVAYMQEEVESRMASWVMHNRSYDVGLGTEMGFNFEAADVHDSMYMLYLLGTYAQGLKPAAWRFLGIQHQSFAETVGRAGVAKQVEWLERVRALAIPKPVPFVTRMNDGSRAIFSPEAPAKTAERIIKDVQAGKRNKDGELTNPLARWRKCSTALSAERTEYKRTQRQHVENLIGPIPPHSLADITLADAVDYASKDADYTLRLFEVLRPMLKDVGKWQLYLNGMELAHTAEEMMFGGMPIDVDYCKRLREALTAEYWRIHEQIRSEYFDGKPFNPRSIDDVRELLECRGLQSKKMSKKTGKPSTGKSAIEHLRLKDPAVELMFQARERAHTVSSFLNPMIADATQSPWGDWQAIKCGIQMTRTASRRWATKEPNLLGIPSKKDTVRAPDDVIYYDEDGEPEEGPVMEYSGLIVRNAFTAPPGYMMVVADLKTIEICIAAHVTKDPLLLESFTDPDVDWHRRTASMAFGVPECKITPAQRTVGKITNFSVIYGCGGHTLWELFQKSGLECWDYDDIQAKGPEVPANVWTVPKCQAVCDGWMNTYVGVKNAILSAAESTYRTGYAEDMWGMRRYLPGIWALDKGAVNEAIRHAFSLWVQGGAQGCIQNSQRAFAWDVRAMRAEGYKVWHLLQVHDELVMLCEERIAERVEERLVWHLEHSHGIKNPLVPILADSCIVDRWGDAK